MLPAARTERADLVPSVHDQRRGEGAAIAGNDNACRRTASHGLPTGGGGNVYALRSGDADDLVWQPSVRAAGTAIAVFVETVGRIDTGAAAVRAADGGCIAWCGLADVAAQAGIAHRDLAIGRASVDVGGQAAADALVPGAPRSARYIYLYEGEDAFFN